MMEVIFVFGGALLATGVGVAYWTAPPREASLWRRAVASSYGPAIALVFAVAGFLWPDAYRYTAEGVRIFLWLNVLPLGLLLCSLVLYPGSRRFHFALVPIALLAWLWTFAMGFIAVNGM
jgi:hypothetical protein